MLHILCGAQILTITADDRKPVSDCLDRIIEHLIEVAQKEEEKGRGRGKDSEANSLVGKESGEYIFRLCLPKEATGSPKHKS